jgi:hypothetical protein
MSSLHIAYNQKSDQDVYMGASGMSGSRNSKRYAAFGEYDATARLLHPTRLLGDLLEYDYEEGEEIGLPSRPQQTGPLAATYRTPGYF